MDLTNLLEKARVQFKLGKPFVLFKKPNSPHVQGYFQHNTEQYELSSFENQGFVFADFLGDRKLIILKSKSEVYAVPCTETTNSFKEPIMEIPSISKDKRTHVDLVSKGIDFIKSGAAEKVVLSRHEQFQLSSFSLEASFEFLIANYKNTLCYAWFHPTTGIWLGASPETLLSIHDSQLITMSLAGTQAFSDREAVQWSEKEKKEQQYVTDYIAQILREQLDEVSISKPYTVQAGSLLHLRSDLSARLNKNSDINTLLRRIHPTPAVCGLPKEEALKFIIEQEAYDREFYSGYLGELNGYAKCDLYVNLRCVKIDGSTASVYVGGGITADSNPENEWFETVEKSKVIKKALAYR